MHFLPAPTNPPLQVSLTAKQQQLADPRMEEEVRGLQKKITDLHAHASMLRQVRA
jgi:hypothetical protein